MSNGLRSGSKPRYSAIGRLSGRLLTQSSGSVSRKLPMSVTRKPKWFSPSRALSVALISRRVRSGSSAIGRPAHHAALLAQALAGRVLAEAKHVHVEVEHLVVVRHAHRQVANAWEAALDRRRVELARGEADGLAERVAHAVLAVEQVAGLRLEVGARRELLQPPLDLADIVDRDAEVAGPGRLRAGLRLEQRDVVEAVGERDVAGVGPAKLPQLEVRRVEPRQPLRLLAHDRQVTNLRAHGRLPRVFGHPSTRPPQGQQNAAPVVPSATPGAAGRGRRRAGAAPAVGAFRRGHAGG